jgi:WD40 repeat protein
VCVCTAKSGKPAPRLKQLSRRTNIRSVVFSPDSTLLGASDEKGGLSVWSLESDCWRKERSFDLGGPPLLISLIAFSPDSHLLLSGSSDQFICVWDVGSVQCRVELNFELREKEWYARVAFTDNGARIVAIEDKGSMGVWNTSSDGCTIFDEGGRPSLFFFQADGWLYGPATSEGHVRRLCWIPPSRRLNRAVNWFRGQVHDNVVTIINADGFVTKIDISGALA